MVGTLQAAVLGEKQPIQEQKWYLLLKTSSTGSELQLGLCSTRQSPLSSFGQQGHCQEWPPRRAGCGSESTLSLTSALNSRDWILV